MWDKETSKTKKPEETSVEGNTENSASRYFKRNNLYENVSPGTDTVVVATYVVNDDDDCDDNRRNVTERSRPLGTEQNDIDHLLSIVQLSDGPSTSSSSHQNALPNKVPYSAKLSDLKSVLLTSAASMSTAAKEIPNTEELTVAIDNDELPNKNKNIKSQSSMQSNKSANSVKYSPITRKPIQNEKVPEQRSKHVPSDNVAGPQIQNLYDKSLNLSTEDLQSVTRANSTASVEDLTSMSENRACSPSPSSVTSASTLRFARSTSGRRMDCLRHMRRPPKEPEEYLDALFPHIRKAHNQIRKALLHAPLTDVKDNALLKKKMLELIQVYTSGCKDEFERVGPSLVLCRRLKRNIIRVLDLFHEICASSREDHAYLYHISQLIAVYTSLEIRLSFNLTRLQKCALIHRISHIINKHLMVKNESVAKENILRMFLRMPDTYSQRFIMEPLFNTFLQEIPTSSHTWCQKELPDKIFVQYIIILHIWKEMLRDPLEQVELINRAQHFMCPTKTLHANPMYANHLPTIHTRKHAVKDILNSLKFFQDLRNAAICDDTLHDGDDDIEVVIDEVINTPFWDFGATYTGDSKQPRQLNRRVITADPSECVDLTQEDEQQSRIDTPLEWLTKLKERAAERVQVDESEKVICLDSDSDGELFCGSILDPSESYQDCDAVDTDYTSLDGSTTDDKELSEDEVLSGNGITHNGLRTYLAPRTKNQINVTNEKRATACATLVTDPYERTRDCDGEGDSAAVGTKKSTVATTATSAESTLPLIVNSFTVRGKQNMHLLNSPRFSLDIGPERLGSEDIEFHDTSDDVRELTVNLKGTKNQNHVKRAVSNEHTARLAASVGGYYEKELNNDVTEEEDDYNSLPSTATSSTTTLGKVIYTQTLMRPSQNFLTEYDDERDDDYNHTDGTAQNVVDDVGTKADNKKQMLLLGDDKPVKKQVKFNDNPIGPTRRPHTKLPIKPAIHLSKIQANNQQPIFSNSPQPRFLSPSSSTSSTTESLKQMAQKGRNFVDIIKTKHKSKKLLKRSSTIIIDSDDDDDDDIVYLNTSANKNMNLVSTQPIPSKNAYKKLITNEQMNLPICNSNNNRMCKMQACDVSNSTTMIPNGPKDISSTNNISKQSVDFKRISANEERVNNDRVVSIVSANVGVLEMVKQVEREEQNSNVSTTTGPNVDSNIVDESSLDLESTCVEEAYSAHSLEVISGSEVCTSTSTDAFLQSTECRETNIKQTSTSPATTTANPDSVTVVEDVVLLPNTIDSKNLNTSAAIADKLNQRMDVEKALNESESLGNDMNNDSVSKHITCEGKGDLDDKYKSDVQTTVVQLHLDSQCANKVGDESAQGTEVDKCQDLNEEAAILTEKMQSEIAAVISKETVDCGDDNDLQNKVVGAVKHLSSTEKINDENNCNDFVTTEIVTEITETLNKQSKQQNEFKETFGTSGTIEANLDKSLQETQSSRQIVSDGLELIITVNTENNVPTKELNKNIVEKSDIPTVATEECLTEKQVLEEPTLRDTSNTTLDSKVIITVNTVTLSPQSENNMMEKILTSIEELNVEEEATHQPAENEINEAHNPTKAAQETAMELDSAAVTELNVDVTNLRIESSTIQAITAANLNENNIETTSVAKNPVVAVHATDNLNECQMTTTEAEQKININIDLEALKNGKCMTNQIEMKKGLETVRNNIDAKISMDLSEPIAVPTEIFNATIAKSDGLVRLVEAVKAVEALTFTKQITEYIVPADSGQNVQENRGENETATDQNSKNVLTIATNLNLSTATLESTKTNDNLTGKALQTLENSLEKTDTHCTLLKPKDIVSNNSYFSGDKSPKTNLERLAEAAVQKYGEHVADRETCSVAHMKAECNKLADESLAVENIDKKSCEMDKLQTDIIGGAIGTDSGNIENNHDVKKIAESESTTIELNITKLQADQQQIACQEQPKSTAIVIDNIHISQPVDYDMHIVNLSDDNGIGMQDYCMFNAITPQADISKSQEYGICDNIPEIATKKSTNVSTFHSHFESFLSTLKTNEERKCEVKEQRRSPRTQKLYATTEISPPTSENLKTVVSEKIDSSSRHNAIKKVLSKSNEDLVTNEVTDSKSQAQPSPTLSASTDSEFSNVELRKGYSLRKSEQWKVVKNTSLRASPPGNQAECLDTRKSVNPIPTPKRCIKIRLARAKVPTMAERKAQPISAEETEANIEMQFGDVSHRPITRRLAAALNSSLQMVTENAVIEPIKSFARGKKSKSKLAENTSMKRRKYENLVSTQRQNERVNKAATAKETILHIEAISSNVKDKRKHCALELIQKSHTEPRDAVTIEQIGHIGNNETSSDDCTGFPEEIAAKRMKIKKRQAVMKNVVTETVTTMQNADITFETVFVKPTKAIQNSKPKNLSATKAIEARSIEETETLIILNNTERLHDEDVLDYKPTVEVTMQEQKVESDKIQEQATTNVLSTTCTSQNTIEADSIQLTEKPELDNNGELSGEPKVRMDGIDDPTGCNEQGSVAIADNSKNSDNTIIWNGLRVLEENCSEASGEILNKKSAVISQNNTVRVETDELINKSCAETSVYIRESVLRTPNHITPSDKSSSIGESEVASEVLGLVKNKTINAEQAKVESTEKTSVSVSIEETTNKVDSKTEVLIRESVSNTPDDERHLIESSSTFDVNDTSALVLDEEIKGDFVETNDSEKTITAETGMSVLEEDINKSCTEKRVVIGETGLNTQAGVTTLDESSFREHSGEINVSNVDESVSREAVKTATLTAETGMSVLEEDINKSCTEKIVVIGGTVLNTQAGVTTLDESSSTNNPEDKNVSNVDESVSGEAPKAAENAFTTAPILEEIINKDNTLTNDIITDTVYKAPERLTHNDDISSKHDTKEAIGLYLDGEIQKQLLKTSDSQEPLTTETSVSDLEQDINNSCAVETRNELVTPTKPILLTNELESAPITYREDADTLPENNEAPPLIDISNFTSLTLDTKTVRDFRDVSEFLDEDTNINLRISHIQIAEKSEYLNETESINTLKTNMEVDKLLEEYNHSARLIASANLKIPTAMQTPTDGRTPACSSVTFSFTASDSSSSFTHSCSCSTTSTVNSATDLYKNEPTSFKVVQSQAQVVELLSSTNTSFQELSLLDLDHDVIMSNDDLLSELIPTTMMDTMTATSLEHNYAIKPFETAIRNEYDIQSEDNGNTEEEELLNTNNNEIPLQVPSLKVSIPIAFIKRFEELTDNRTKNWYLTEKPTTSKAAMAALAKRNAHFKTDIVHILNSNSVSRPNQITEPTFTESLENKQDIATTDSAVTQQLLAGDSCSPLPSLPLKKRRNISGVLEEDFCSASVMLSDDSDLVTLISQGSRSNESKNLSVVTTQIDENKQIEFDNTSAEVETVIVQQTAIEKQTDCQYETNDEIVTETKQDIRENIIADIENTGASNEDMASGQELVRYQQKELILQLETEKIQMSENSVTDQQSRAINDITDESAVQEVQKDRTINNTTPIAQDFTDGTTLLLDQQNRIADKTETDETVTNIEFQEIMQQNDTETECQETMQQNDTEAEFQGAPAQNDTETARNENQIENVIPSENLNDSEMTPVQHTFVPEQQDFALNETCHAEDFKDATATGLLDDAKSIAVFKEIQELMTIQQIHCKDNTLESFNDRANEVILSSYEDQFLVTVCLNEADTVSGFEATNNYFTSKEYAENDFDIGNDVIISTQEIKEESTEFMSNLNSPKNSPINLTKPLSTNAVDLNTPIIKQNEFFKFTSDSTHSLAPTNSTNFQLFTMPNNEIVTTDLNVNNMTQITNCDLNLDQAEPGDSKNLVDMSQMDELSFGEHETLQTTQLPQPIEQMDQLEYNNFAQSQIHNAITDTCTTDTFVGVATSLKISTNAEQTENVRETHSTVTPTIKICSTNKSKPKEDNDIVAMPTILAQSEHLTKPSTLSPVLPLIKPTTTTINTIYEKSNTIFSFSDIETETTLAQNFVSANNFATTTTASIADNCTTTTLRTDVDKSPTTQPSQSSISQLQTPTTPRNSTQSTIRARAPARVQIVTPQRKNRDIAPKTSEEEAKTPNIIFTNTTTSYCNSVEFDMSQVAATIPVDYATTPPRYANLFQFEKYIQKLMTLIDVPGIVDSARNLFVDKQALAEAHAALLAQATQFDDEGNAISEPLLLKYHKDGTISILNDNDECIILTANMSKMVKSLSLALSILQEQQSPVLGMRARIHALLKQLTQTNTTAKTAHFAPNIINSTVIPTAVVNPTNLVDNSRDLDMPASNAMAYGSDIGGEIRQQVQPPLEVLNANLQNLQLYATNWQNIEDNGLITSIPNADLDALPFAADDAATNYEHAVSFNFDEPVAILPSNENTNATRFENAFHATLERTVEENCTKPAQNRFVHWQHERASANNVSASATHIPPSCTDVVYEQNVNGAHENVATGCMDVNNDNLHVVMSDHRLDTLMEPYAMASNKAHVISEVGSKRLATVSPKGEKTKKTVYHTRDDNNQHARTQSTHRKSTAQSSPKKLPTKRVEKVPKAQCLTASVAVTPPQEHTRNATNSKARSMPQSNSTVPRTTHTIHYRHMPQPTVTASMEYKPSATLHYKQPVPRQQQQQQQRIASLQMPIHYVASNANHLPPAMPHISLENDSSLPLFAQQYAQHSTLSGGVGLLHNNNIRYLLATPHTRDRNVIADSPEILAQYPQYQLQALHTPPNFADNLKLNELQLQSIIRNATHGEIVGDRGSTAVADVAAAPATTTNVLRSFRSALRTSTVNTPKTDSTPSFNNDTHTTAAETLLTTQQQQQHQQHTEHQQQHPIPFVQPTSALIISSMQQKQEAELESLRQELAKRDTQLQTDLHLPLVQHESRGPPKVERNHGMYTTITPISSVQTKHQQHSDEREILLSPQQRTHTHSTIANNPKAPISPSTQANVSRKRGRPRKYNLGDDMLVATSDLLQQQSVGETAQKYAKMHESPCKKREDASARHKQHAHAKIRQILPTAQHLSNIKTHDATTLPASTLTKATPSELRPSFTSAANAFHLIEHMVETISPQNQDKSTAIDQQQQPQQASHLLHQQLPQIQTSSTNSPLVDQGNV
ncbi:uncharacterized protein LOC105221540 isoform X2 [Zeugodacus cucurbitae]|nr:uncharacterized protein LOC105221540 isoform X2 [Zeugodacus cucurbitae]